MCWKETFDLRGKQTSVAYSGEAVQSELERVLLMLINRVAVSRRPLSRACRPLDERRRFNRPRPCRGIQITYLNPKLPACTHPARRHKYTCTSFPPCLISPGAVSLNDVRSVGLAATAPVPRRCVSCQTLRQTDSNKQKTRGGGCSGEEPKTKSAILRRFCFSSVVFTK